MSKYPKWTSVEDYKLKKLFGFIEAEDLCALLGRSLKGCSVRASRLGVRRQRYGLTALDVSKILGLNVTTVCKYLEEGRMRGNKRPSYESYRQGNIWQVTGRQLRLFIKQQFLLYNHKALNSKWRRYRPKILRAKWITLDEAVAKYFYVKMWFYQHAWAGRLWAKKGWSPNAPWQLYLYLPDLESILTLGKVNRPDMALVPNRYKKGKERGWLVPVGAR